MQRFTIYFFSVRRFTCFRRFFLPSSGDQHCTYSFFYVLLTVHLSIFILIINQLDVQNLFYNKFISCLFLFRAPCAHRQDIKTVLCSLWYHHTYRWPSRAHVCTGRITLCPAYHGRKLGLKCLDIPLFNFVRYSHALYCNERACVKIDTQPVVVKSFYQISFAFQVTKPNLDPNSCIQQPVSHCFNFPSYRKQLPTGRF